MKTVHPSLDLTESRILARPDESACQAFVNWTAHKALPLWASHNDPLRFPFVECLTPEGWPSKPRGVRLRVMARQVIVYSQAANAGIHGALEKAQQGWDALYRAYWSITTGWAECVVPPRKAVDTKFSLYNQAFAIFAAASWAEASFRSEPVAMARRTINLIDRRLATGDELGWRSEEFSAVRDQNSHMHYLEALLALHRIEPSYLVRSRIDELLRLLRRHLLQPHGAIVERFNVQWRFDEEHAEVEPGHLYEWYSLITAAREQGFTIDTDESNLIRFAETFGWNNKSGLLYNTCNLDGQPKDASHRLWPHCEALRAVSLLPELDQARAEQIAATIKSVFLDPAPDGAWIDRVTDGLDPVRQEIPASSLYHLWGAAHALVTAGLAQWPTDASC